MHFEYSFSIRYNSNVGRCHYTIKGIPQDNARQTIQNFQLTMVPESRPQWSFDSLGNRYIWGCNKVAHDLFIFSISGDATCGRTYYESVSTDTERMIYAHPTRQNQAGPGLLSYYEELAPEVRQLKGNYEIGLFLMDRLHRDFVYQQNITNFHTTAEEAYALGRGVCQDYSQILISLLHQAGCPARYVTGLLLGEGQTHGWVEVESGGKWYGLDPTNNTRVDDEHIKIGHGRDAYECQINRGIMFGGGDNKLESHVLVTDCGTGSIFLNKNMGEISLI